MRCGLLELGLGHRCLCLKQTQPSVRGTRERKNYESFFTIDHVRLGWMF